MHRRVLILILCGLGSSSILFFSIRYLHISICPKLEAPTAFVLKQQDNKPQVTLPDTSKKIELQQRDISQPDKKICFTTQSQETANTILTVEGTIPSWLSGTFYYNGPAQFELGNQPFKRSFDGFAMVHRFTINQGQISYTNKYVDSSFKKEAHEKGRLPVGFAEKPNWLNKLSALLAKPKNYDNTNMHLWMINNTLLALTETPDHIQLDPETLTTKKPFAFPCTQKSHICTIHPLYDAHTDQWYNLHTTFGHTSQYQICTINPHTCERSIISSISVDYPAYIHSFALTKDYILVVESPLIVNPYDLLGSSKRFVDHFTWKPERKNKLFILHKKSGKEIHRMQLADIPFFFFHITNAFQHHDSINLDIITYPDISIVQSSSLLTNLRDNNKEKDKGHLERFSINLKTKYTQRKLLCNEHIEFPIINQEYAQKEYTYVYGVGYTNQSLKKIDLHNGTALTWQDKDCIVSEPQFIARPEAHTEDDGILLAIVTDTKLKRSGLLILDAQSYKTHGYAWLTQHIPLGYHGIFVQK